MDVDNAGDECVDDESSDAGKSHGFTRETIDSGSATRLFCAPYSFHSCRVRISLLRASFVHDMSIWRSNHRGGVDGDVIVVVARRRSFESSSRTRKIQSNTKCNFANPFDVRAAVVVGSSILSEVSSVHGALNRWRTMRNNSIWTN